MPLPLRGVAVASKSSSRVKAIFGDVVRDRAGEEITHRASTLAKQASIGNGASGDVVDGVGP